MFSISHKDIVDAAKYECQPQWERTLRALSAGEFATILDMGGGKG
jgi:hypothetical protein